MSGNVPLSSFSPPAAAPVVAPPVPAPPASGHAPDLRSKLPAFALADAPAPAPSQTPAIPPPPQEVTLRFRHEDVKVSPDELRRLAQIGLSAQHLDQRRAQIDQREQANARKLEVADALAALAQIDPRRYQMVNQILAGRDPVGQDSGDDGLTPQGQQGTITPEIEMRLAQLERSQQAALASLHQRDAEVQMRDAIGQHEILRQSPEAAELARLQMNALIQSGEVADFHAAATIVADRQRRIIQQHMDAELRRRTEARDQSPARSQPPSSALPRLDKSQLSYSGHRSGSTRQQLSDWVKKFKATLNPDVT